MKLVKLTQGKFAFVDDDIFEIVNKYKWHVVKRGKNNYASRTCLEGKKKIIYMHRFILDITNPKEIVDHVDGNGLNNIKKNIRICNTFENARNSRSRENKSSIYKGVHFNKKSNKWRAMICINNKSMHLGMFDNEEDAGKKYDEVAKINYGEFAKLNFK